MTVLLDAAGRRRSPATLPGYHAGRPQRNKGMRYPADPPTVEEIVAVMRHASDDRHGWRVRGMIVVLWRAGLRVQEALALAEHDLDHRRGSILIRNGKGGRRREVGMDDWGWEHLHPWLSARAELPVGPLFCIIDGPTRGRPWSGAAVRREFRHLAAEAGVRRRFAPHQLRHAHALELAREGVPLNIIQRQLGHANLGTTSIYLQGIDPEEIITSCCLQAAAAWFRFRSSATADSDDVDRGSALTSQCCGGQGQLAPEVAKPAAGTPGKLVDEQPPKASAEPAKGADIEHRLCPRAVAPTATRCVAPSHNTRAYQTNAGLPPMDDDRGTPPARLADSVHGATVARCGLLDITPLG